MRGVLAVDRAADKRAGRAGARADEATSPEQLDEPAEVVPDFVGSNETLAHASTRHAQRLHRAGRRGDGNPSFALGRVPHEASFTTSIWAHVGPDLSYGDHKRRSIVACRNERVRAV